MDTEHLASFLENPESATDWLRSLGIVDVERAQTNLFAIGKVSLDLLSHIAARLNDLLPLSSDPDLALNTLDRFVAASRSPLSLLTLFELDENALPTLLQLFATSRFLGDVLVNDPESFELLRITEGKPARREHLVAELMSEFRPLNDRRAVLAGLRRHKRRETLRIAYGDIVLQQRLQVVTQQISYLADALCETALAFAQRQLNERWGRPRSADGQATRFTVLAMGKLGGCELNYSSDIDLVFIYEGDGRTDGAKRVSAAEYYDRLAQDFTKLLTENTELGTVYRVDLRLRPHGHRGPLVNRLEAALHYYDVMGRTWERQAFVKARPIAGDLTLGNKFLAMLEPWVYRRYLTRADITGVKALKRKIEHQTRREGTDQRDVKTGHGGIRDIEFVIQFLQLLNGGDIPSVRTQNTLNAIARLGEVDCLTVEERNTLENNYTYLRKLEHLLQIMLDVQTHTLPDSDAELRRLAIRMGGHGDDPNLLQTFKDDYKQRGERNRKILDFLLHDAFGDSAEAEPEVDVILDPDPDPKLIASTLKPYGFRNIDAAYHNLVALSVERIRFLSTRRCRHFLASIAPSLLKAVGQTPDPDAALVNLCQVSDSLGGKGVLWELFSFNRPSLQLYVRLCAATPYLAAILTSNPGMLDELMDSLVLNKLPDVTTLKRSLEDRCRGAEDLEPILHSFKNAHHLNAGVRDILGKEHIRNTTAFLSDVAEVCVQQIADAEYRALIERFGQPWDSQTDQPSSLVIVGMGKLGGREPNYHSDLDVVFLFPCDGMTRHAQRKKSDRTTSNQHFFSELAQRITKRVNRMGPHGRLYEMDARLRPSGKSGSLAVSFDALRRYFAVGQGQLWERQALCRSRPIVGSDDARRGAVELIRSIIIEPEWQPVFANAIFDMRQRMEETASPRNLKRRPGGIVDVEFIAQMLQLKYAAHSPEVLQPGTIEALSALAEKGYLASEQADFLKESYRFLRSVEARLRLMNTTGRHDLPDDEQELAKLAYLFGSTTGAALAEQCETYTRENRRLFVELFRAAGTQ